MSVVSYYTPAAMYRHQHQAAAAAAAAQTGAFHHHAAANGVHAHAWYPAGYHHQAGAQVAGAPPTASYCMQDEQQMWHSHHNAHAAAAAAAAAFHTDFGAHDFAHAGAQHNHHHQQQQQLNLPENQLPSPPITVSGSELSSPGGAGGGSVTPPNTSTKTRPTPARTPYDWMNKPSYQSQPNPGKTRTKDKYRVVYTDFQRIELEKEFTLNNKYITIRRKTELAANLGLSERQIKIWFQNRRAKERKQLKKRLEETGKDDVNAGLHLHQYEQKMAQMAQLQNQYVGQLAMPPSGSHNHPHHQQQLPQPQQQQQQQQQQPHAPTQNMAGHTMMDLSPNGHRMTALMEPDYDNKEEEIKFDYAASPRPQQPQQQLQAVV